MFVHPKTGSKGSSNITEESKKLLYEGVLESIDCKDFYKIDVDIQNPKKLIFTHISEVPKEKEGDKAED